VLFFKAPEYLPKDVSLFLIWIPAPELINLTKYFF
jgi:hypothetical protein